VRVVVAITARKGDHAKFHCTLARRGYSSVTNPRFAKE
jgi:hypothetical protein